MSGTKAEDTKRDGFGQIGKPILRKEDARLLRGRGTYVDDIEVSGALHACFVRSPHAHARIIGFDMDQAKTLPGVVAVLTGQEINAWTNSLQLAPPIEGLQPTEMTTLPVDKVRFHGDPVACVVATDRYVAEDAAELVYVDYDGLDAVTSYESALAAGAPLVDEALPSNLVSHQKFEAGDIARRKAEAHRIVEATFAMQRMTHLPIETRGCIAVWDDGRQHLTMHIGSQAPHPMRSALAGRLKLAEHQVTVSSPDVGGAFGQKIIVYREEITVAAIARHLKRPVRWREDRLENLSSSLQARENTVHTRAAVTADGRILSLEAEILEDFGAYCFYPANYLARVIGMILTGPYRIQDYAFEVKIALTNKCGAGPMRAPMAITSLVMDGTLDAVARDLDLDPAEVRRVNMLRPTDLPYVMPTGETLEDVTPSECFERGLEEIDYAGFRARQADDRAREIYRGIGICNVIESTTYGSAFYRAAGIPGSGHEAAWVKIEPSGAIRASTGLMGAGQSYETPYAQVVAEGLGVDTSQVDILLGNTDIAPYGMGARGSRGATAGGGTLFLTALDLKAKMLDIAAALLGLNSPRELDIENGKVLRHIGGEWTETGVGIADIARTAYLDPLNLPAGTQPGLEMHRAWDPPQMTYSNSSHFCAVTLDAATGQIRIDRYLVVEDCGTVLNPLVVEGQQQGATVMGIGGVLFEHMVYDESGQNLCGTLADYMIPTASDAPEIEIVAQHTPSKRTPAGIKGMAEGGVMGAIGAVNNAVNDALRPFGVVAERQPLSPDYIRSLLRVAV
jgi:carbon-monoxide dehydrogenase large subunit